jgi:hypothetical protein
MADIFKDDSARLAGTQNLFDLEKQRALRFVLKAMRPREGVLLGNSSDREWLTGEPSDKHVVVRNVIFADLPDVPSGDLTKVLGVGTLSPGIPLTGEHALSTGILESNAHSAYSGEEVDKFERGIFWPRKGWEMFGALVVRAARPFPG